jgi:uroporphyrin-III C-methyltransferase/precorrin-2 dehydrogenase/sirohydrochlorin ferrochelatase
MQHYPIFLATPGRRVIVAGGGEAALAKLRLLLKTAARISVYAETPAHDIAVWAAEGRLELDRRPFTTGDAIGAALVYAATEDAEADAEVRQIANTEGALVNIVDNLNDSDFITPAIVDRDPVTVAIGTEGAAPVLARAIKADLEARLSPLLGLLARIGKTFRHHAEVLPPGRRRRDFWRDYYFNSGPRAAELGGEGSVHNALEDLLADHRDLTDRKGTVAFVGAGPGDPELLTLKARKALDEADVVIYDRLVGAQILELARREAVMIYAGKEGFGTSTAQSDINALMIEHARSGAQVVRLKSGDPTVYGRLDEEIDALDDAEVDWHIVPGITSASAAAAVLGQSLTKRERNSSLRFLTGHDIKGFAEQDWATLARPGEVAAIYMGKKASRFLQGRLLMHGAGAATPITVIENVSRADQTIHATDLGGLAESASRLTSPAILIYGLAPRSAQAAIETVKEFA